MRAERDQINKCKLKWVLEYPNPCECTSVVMGRFNTWIPERLFAPVAVDRPLVSDDIKAIRRHYWSQCDKESKFTKGIKMRFSVIYNKRINTCSVRDSITLLPRSASRGSVSAHQKSISPPLYPGTTNGDSYERVNVTWPV